MAYIKFKEDNEPSMKKNYIPNSVKINEYHEKIHKMNKLFNEEYIKTQERIQKNYKYSITKWKINFIFSGVLNVLFISALLYKYFFSSH